MTDYAHLAGHRLPGGTYTLPAHEAWLWADAALAEPDRELANPAIAYMVGLHGGGASIADLFRLLEADEGSGVLFGEVDFEFDAPLRAGTTYAVDGEVVAVERKEGRRAGAFDRVSFAHRISDAASGAPVARVSHVWIFPRGEEGA